MMKPFFLCSDDWWSEARRVRKGPPIACVEAGQVLPRAVACRSHNETVVYPFSGQQAGGQSRHQLHAIKSDSNCTHVGPTPRPPTKTALQSLYIKSCNSWYSPLHSDTPPGVHKFARYCVSISTLFPHPFSFKWFPQISTGFDFLKNTKHGSVNKRTRKNNIFIGLLFSKSTEPIYL